METSGSAYFGYSLIIGLAVVTLFDLAYTAVLHYIRGNRYFREFSSARALLFSTPEGDFRLDKTHRNFNFRRRGESSWHTVNYEDIDSIYAFSTEESASLFEFFLSDWGLWDLRGNYRDVFTKASVRLWLRNAQEIPLMTLTQFEQREWFLGRLTHRFTLFVLRRMGWYRDLEVTVGERIEMFICKFADYGLHLGRRRGSM